MRISGVIYHGMSLIERKEGLKELIRNEWVAQETGNTHPIKNKLCPGITSSSNKEKKIRIPYTQLHIHPCGFNFGVIYVSGRNVTLVLVALLRGKHADIQYGCVKRKPLEKMLLKAKSTLNMREIASHFKVSEERQLTAYEVSQKIQTLFRCLEQVPLVTKTLQLIKQRDCDFDAIYAAEVEQSEYVKELFEKWCTSHFSTKHAHA